MRLTKESMSDMDDLGGELSKNEADRGLLLKLKANGGKKSKPKKTELGNYKLMFYS